MSLDTEKRQEIINGLLNNFFSGKINPKKLMSNLSVALGDNALISEAEKLWEERNKEIEEKIYQDFRGASSKDIKQILESKKPKFESSMRLAKDIESFSENDIKNSLPADKLMYNQDIFNNRLKGLDITSLDTQTEKRIIDALTKDSKGLTRQEVILFYSLMKANKLSSGEDQSKVREKIGMDKYHKALGSTFVGLIYPKRITQEDLTKINNGVKIDREALKDTLVDKIKNHNFSSFPYFMLLGLQKGSDMYDKFINMATLGSKVFGEDVEKIIKYTLFYIIFKGVDDKFLKFANIQDVAKAFLHAKSSKPFSPEGAGLVIFLDTFFYALCTQIYEINNNYQKSDDSKKVKIYKLYSSEDRLRMIVRNSLSITDKVIQRMSLDHKKLMGVFTKYLEKQNGFLTKEDVFSGAFDFEKILV